MSGTPIVLPVDAGLYCPAGDFYVDPWKPVSSAVITHAHGDHARPGSGRYWAARPGAEILGHRLGPAADVEPLDYGEVRRFGEARVSLHPAGHVLGSAQVRLEVRGEVWVVSGDYKREPDPTCAPFEPVACDTFITEATFALPAYRWPPTAVVAAEIRQWWHRNREAGRCSLLACYSLGKAQRVLAELGRLAEEPPWVHAAIDDLCNLYRRAGIDLPPTRRFVPEDARRMPGELLLAPPGCEGAAWTRRLGPLSTGFCSGWMRVRGHRRRRGYDTGFVISDHVDWPGLLRTVRETGARRVLATHGYADALVRYLGEQGLVAAPLATAFARESG